MADIKGKFPNGLAAAMQRERIGSTKLGAQIGETKQNVGRWADQSRKLPAPVADKIAPILKTTAAELLMVDTPVRQQAGSKPIKIPELKASAVRVPLISWVSAGKLSHQDGVRPTDINKYLVADLSPKGDWVALSVQGDSMDLVARDGAIIFVDRKDDRLRDNAFYVFSLDDGSTTFKRYRTGSPGRLQPYSHNPDHETQVASDGMRVIGRVKRTLLDL